MSANIYVSQVKPVEGHAIGCLAPSSFIDTMTQVFGCFPCQVGAQDVKQIQVMAVMFGQDRYNPYSQLLKQIEKLGTIEVYAEY